MQIVYCLLIVCVQIEVLCKQDVNMIVDVHDETMVPLEK